MDNFQALLQRRDRVFRWDQALQCGVSRHQLMADLAARRIRRVLPEVYVDHTGTPTVQERRRAALLYVGEDAYLSLWTAADVHGFGGFGYGVVHVTAPGFPRQSVDGQVWVHRTRHAIAVDVVEVMGLAVSSRARTVVDLHARLSEREARYVLARALQRKIVPAAEVVAILDAWPRAPRGPRLRRMLVAAVAMRAGGETRLAEAVAARGFPGRPNALVEVMPGVLREGDLVYDDERVVVQQESVAFHGLLPDIEADIARDDLWIRAGWIVVRVTNREVEEHLDHACDRVISVVSRRRSELYRLRCG